MKKEDKEENLTAEIFKLNMTQKQNLNTSQCTISPQKLQVNTPDNKFC